MSAICATSFCRRSVPRPLHGPRPNIPPVKRELAARAATAAFVAVGPNDVTALAANAAAQAVRAAATTDAFNAAARAAAYAAEAAARAADSGTGHSDGFNLKFAEASGADPVTAAFWSAVSIDATQVEEGVAASVIAGSMPWPLHTLQPEPLQSLWESCARREAGLTGVDHLVRRPCR
jgi:hypothetical protein